MLFLLSIVVQNRGIGNGFADTTWRDFLNVDGCLQREVVLRVRAPGFGKPKDEIFVIRAKGEPTRTCDPAERQCVRQ